MKMSPFSECLQMSYLLKADNGIVSVISDICITNYLKSCRQHISNKTFKFYHKT